ncbi:MAG TPA: S41 family peptidase [Gemmatimonadaceae bacterium]
MMRMPHQAKDIGSRRAWRLLLVAGASMSLACKDSLTDPVEAQRAREHLAALLDIMEANSINRHVIDWSAFRATVLSRAPDPAHIGDTFEAIHTALGLLDDNHSHYTAPLEYRTTITNSRITCMAPTVPQPDVPADIGYVRVSGFSGGGSAASSFASSLQTQIRLRDVATGVAGWIVDLRGNGGGNMWPMIAGLGPILGEQTLGYFIDPDGVEFRWEYRGGVAIVNGMTAVAVPSPYTLRNADPRVAVLIDGRVASSGEATAIAFSGRPNTRFFGTATCGLSTANSAFGVDGASLVLTVATIADRNKLAYGDTLSPHEVIPDNTAVVERAIAWLRGL